MWYDLRCNKKSCKGRLPDHEKDILAPFPPCPVCGGEMRNNNYKSARVAIKGSGYTKECIR